MACFEASRLLSLCLALLPVLPAVISAAPEPTPALTHHGGRLLTGHLSVGIVWYGPIPRAQKKAILSFLRSLKQNETAATDRPQVSSWWNIVESYQTMAKVPTRGIPNISVKVINQASDPNYSLGKVVIKDFIKQLIPKATGGNPNALAIIVASKGVTVQDMCAGSCVQHGLIDDQLYVAVGDPEEECPECAWPFAGTSGVPLKPPSGDIGADTMVRLLAGGLAGAITNPFGDGFYAYGHGEQLVEATSKCSGVLATATVPVDPVSGGSYNSVGDQGTKFLLPAIWDPKTSSCWTPL
ncbi:protein EXORDIUM-like 1 [Abrus precatorius]|uniref:Protein EXORDIUM-like 1 n=1 Tax=Abrus precatorius TaxID=3816 RepID=A0A8B8LL84_ABRPR|nr:protein EXORDIUM-like 1 [Abrus precatorius]